MTVNVIKKEKRENKTTITKPVEGKANPEKIIESITAILDKELPKLKRNPVFRDFVLYTVMDKLY